MRQLVHFPPSNLAGTERTTYLKQMIRDFIMCDEVRELLALYGFRDDSTQFETYLEHCAEYAKTHMDFRNRKERFQIRDDSFAKEHRSEIEDIVRRLCMDGEEEYLKKDMEIITSMSSPCLLIMGGGAKANTGRAALASRIYSLRHMPVRALSAERIMETDSAITEFDHLTSCVQKSFAIPEKGIVHPADILPSLLSEEERRKLSRTCTWNEYPDIVSLSCPSSDPARRANTFDTISFLVQKEPEMKEKTLVLISSYRYRLYTVFSAERHFGNTLQFFFTGKAAEVRDKENILAYVQEVQAGIVSAKQLYDHLAQK